MNHKLKQLLDKPSPTILITRIDHIGDTLLATPAIKALKNTYPRCRITALATSFTCDVLRGNDCLDEIIVYEPPEKSAQCKKNGFCGIFPADDKFYKGIRERDFDIILNFSAAVKDYKEAARFGGRFRIAPVYRKMVISRIIGGLLLHQGVICDDDPGEYNKKPDSIKLLHEVEQNEKVVSFLGAEPVKTRLILPVLPEDEDFARNLLFNELKIPEKTPVIALQLSDRWFEAEIREHGLSRLIIDLRKEFPDREIICFSYPGIEAIVEEVRKMLPSAADDSINPDVKFVAGLPLKRFAAVLKHCRFILTMHSGATHISAAVGLPSVVVFNSPHYEYFSYREKPWNADFIPVKKNFTEETINKADSAGREEMIKSHINEIVKECQRLEARAES